MAIIYDDSVRTGAFNTPISQMDGTKNYLKHYDNKLYLSFIAANGTRNEKWQAEKELIICERKLSFWEKHPNFIGAEALKGMAKANKVWKEGGAR